MKCTPQKTIVSRVRGGRAAREPERVADVVGDVLDLRHLVVVREDHRAALARQRAHLLRQRCDLGGRERVAACEGAIGRVGAIGRFMAGPP